MARRGVARGGSVLIWKEGAGSFFVDFGIGVLKLRDRQSEVQRVRRQFLVQNLYVGDVQLGVERAEAGHHAKHFSLEAVHHPHHPKGGLHFNVFVKRRETRFHGRLFGRLAHGSDSILSVIRQHNSVSSVASSWPLTLPCSAPLGRESATYGMSAASHRNGSPNSRAFTRTTSAASKAGRRIRAIWLSAGLPARSGSIRPRCSDEFAGTLRYPAKLCLTPFVSTRSHRLSGSEVVDCLAR